MRKLSSLILLQVVSAGLFSQTSPHGAGFEVNCMECHNTSGWKTDMKTLSFNHSVTKFPLTGQHLSVNCRMCHTSLEFSRAETECISCHTDMHNQTVGPDCARCHTPASWIVNDITGIHQRSRFPLVGKHVTADCYDCHINASASLLNFGPLGVQCIDCHRTDYESTTNPNHVTGNFSTDCAGCHPMTAFSWTGASINHDMFPLTGGHAISICNECHKTPDYSSTSPECASCHQADYDATVNPNHNTIGFSINCKDCHTTNPGWKPADYREHDAKSFPVYSGKHLGTWVSCSECHVNPASYAQYTCISCHDHFKPEMDDKHEGVQGYVYSSPDCFACHPTGSAEGTFNHSTSIFPLTGAHASTDCIKCHTTGYPGTPTACYSCHAVDFNQSLNPNHAASGIPTECGTCHTTLPGWKPATFPIHDSYYVIAGAHLAIANDCATCHQGNYNATPNTCSGCHLANYNQTTNPNHAAAQFPTSCSDCHTQTAWIPADWNHDAQYFPIYSGKHRGEWNTCADCHSNPGNYSVFTCTTSCHPQSSTNNDHQGVSNYSYNSAACYNCHPQGTAPKMLERNGQKE